MNKLLIIMICMLCISCKISTEIDQDTRNELHQINENAVKLEKTINELKTEIQELRSAFPGKTKLK